MNSKKKIWEQKLAKFIVSSGKSSQRKCFSSRICRDRGCDGCHWELRSGCIKELGKLYCIFHMSSCLQRLSQCCAVCLWLWLVWQIMRGGDGASSGATCSVVLLEKAALHFQLVHPEKTMNTIKIAEIKVQPQPSFSFHKISISLFLCRFSLIYFDDKCTDEWQ